MCGEGAPGKKIPKLCGAVFAQLLLCSSRQPYVVERDRASRLRLGLGLQAKAKATKGATLARTLGSNYPSRGSKIVAPWDSLLESIFRH